MRVEASAPGKIILFGEHAVVYGQPALAIPINSISAKATVESNQAGLGLLINAVNLESSYTLAAQANDALVVMARLVLDYFRAPEPDATITIESTIPLASGLGSGAAVSAALGRALATYLNQPLENAALSHLVYEVEKLHHGTPSGIDNTVICYNQPVYFIKDKVLEPFVATRPLHLVIGDTGIPSPTRATVGAVRSAWERDKPAFEKYFRAIGAIVDRARSAIESGYWDAIGPLMYENQKLLEQIGVSSPELETLIAAAMRAGALGAKLSGGGGGGNMIALINPEDSESMSLALLSAGAANVITTEVS
jgi:mevalonate kinase